MNATTATPTQTDNKQNKMNPLLARQWIRDNLDNGTYLKAKICGVNSRDVRGKKDPSQTYTFHSLVVETNPTAQKLFIDMRGKALDKNYHLRLASPDYIGKEILLPLAVSAYQGRPQFTFYGEEDLMIFDETEIKL